MTVKAMAHELLQLTLRQLVEIESATRTPISCEVVNGGTTGLSEVADGAELSRRLSALLLWQWKLSNATTASGCSQPCSKQQQMGVADVVRAVRRC